jgi:hypothetical protein
MAKAKDKVLNKGDRDQLLIFANKSIKCAAEEAEMNVAYEEAKFFVLAAVELKFPIEHMLILEKYGAARKDECIRYGGSYDNDSVFRLKSSDAVLVPRFAGCNELHYEWSKEARDKLQKYGVAKIKLEKAFKAKLADYRKLIMGCRTFNEVALVWPAVEALRDKLMPDTAAKRALSVLSEDALARIRADNAGAA